MNDKVKVNKHHYVTPPLKRCPRKNHSKVLQPIITRTDVYRYSFFPDAVEIWNQLPSDVVDQTDVEKFVIGVNAFLEDCCANL